nr:PREDICTED: macrophage mannose receptor 1-like isoform X5 [Paralichthys olivaceus]
MLSAAGFYTGEHLNSRRGSVTRSAEELQEKIKPVKSEMAFYVTLFLLFLGCILCSCSQFPQRQYRYVHLAMNWTSAQNYCREHHTDLATFESADDLQRLKADFSYEWAWLGLRDDPRSWRETLGSDANSWRWSATNETSRTGYRPWNQGEPNAGGGLEMCVWMRADGKWNDARCLEKSHFICYSVTNQKEHKYHYIELLKTWFSARDFCRERYTDLAMIENNAEHHQVFSVKPAGITAWIGLYREPWTWSDMSQSSFRNWKRTCPNNYLGNQFCVGENRLHEWNDLPCEEKYSFICHQDPKWTTTVVKVKFQTDADMTDPAVNAQILQQLGALLTSQTQAPLSVRWKTEPRKTTDNLTDRSRPGPIVHL